MGKLDVSLMRHMCKEDWRVLTAVEMGMKNHDVVPIEIIINIAKLRHGGAQKFLSTLHRFKLVYHDASKYDGYRLTYMGYDFLALHTFAARGTIVSFGHKVGCGKESDVFCALTAEGEEVIIKLERLGRTSFRTIKKNRDYLVHRKSASWFYLSRLAAIKEYSFMKALHARGFPTPVPLDQNRHAILMSKVPGVPLYQIRSGCLETAGSVLDICLGLLARLADHGLVHCDLNEFNIMVSLDGQQVTLIDFPQMISTSHKNAKYYFERDRNCLIKFFRMKMKVNIDASVALPELSDVDPESAINHIDQEVRASGFSHDQEDALESAFISTMTPEDDNEEEAEDQSGSEGEEHGGVVNPEDNDAGGLDASGGEDGIEDEEDSEEEETQEGGGADTCLVGKTGSGGGGAQYNFNPRKDTAWGGVPEDDEEEDNDDDLYGEAASQMGGASMAGSNATGHSAYSQYSSRRSSQRSSSGRSGRRRNEKTEKETKRNKSKNLTRGKKSHKAVY